jgi:carbonic anhydrase
MNNIINISSDNIAGKCDYKCSYTYDYLYTNLVAKNNVNMISIINDGIEPVVKYNNDNYMVSSTMLVSPSLHKFNNNKTDGELLIEHMPIQGGKKMYVCIPIIQSTNFSSASVTIALIIETIKASTSTENNVIRVKSDKFTLNSFIPSGKFYSYNGKDLNNNDSDFVVFGKENAIPMNQTIFNSLTELIQPISIQMTGGELFVNEKGSNFTNSKVDVTSVGDLPSSVEDTPKIVNNVSSSPFIDNEIISIIIQIVLNCLFFFTVFYIINYAFNYLLSGVNNKIYFKT